MKNFLRRQVNLVSTVSKCVQSLSHLQILCNPIDLAHQAPLTMKLSRQEYGSVLPFPPPGHLPHKLIEPVCLQRCRQVLYHFGHLGRCISLKYHTVKPKWNWVHNEQNWKQQAMLIEFETLNTILYASQDPLTSQRLLWRSYIGGKRKISIHSHSSTVLFI